MIMRAARGRSFVPLAASIFLVGALGSTPLWSAEAHAQDAGVAAPTSATDSTREVAERVHTEGGYPDEIAVLEDESGEASLSNGGGGGGSGPQGSVTPHGDRDGGDATRSLDFPLPDFVRDILHALGELLGASARTITYVIFGLGLVALVFFVVYLVTLFRFPKRDLASLRHKTRPESEGGALDPLLEEAMETPEEYARRGQFREAIHAVFVRSLGTLARANDVDRRGRTAREVVRAIERVQQTPEQLPDLLALTELVWFGGRPATQEQYAHAVELASKIGSAATVGPPRSEPNAPAEAP